MALRPVKSDPVTSHDSRATALDFGAPASRRAVQIGQPDGERRKAEGT